ncbi:MAG: tetratricopeptide repeat protein [candidate division KSB1 bacterium]|nr:tetratricopeptide repeat protein [candidate division KSB1 bacterium]MDZ7273013.1 tetratricopeptide repeat protein [candidate division KSB1 bacterium]MDZ7285116.1 tetratricopeptide repeat protein [candidate division KSB1 bacterium]MDZ7298148.1 tetratricopeptide repeat protein [candidate division KSB1 bacterium]MDZ7306902.1 tetratricopeptide repeat protein [candidate division KSB1 bacterium]
MNCSQCGAEVSPQHRFCPACGTKLAHASAGTCAACGSELKPGAKFCHHCGQAVAGAATPPAHGVSGRGTRSPWVTISLLASIPVVVGILFFLFYPRTNPEPVKPSTAAPAVSQNQSPAPRTGGMGGMGGMGDMDAMAPIFAQIDSLKKRVKEDPKDLNALLHLAAIYEMAGKYEEAAGFYRDMLAVKPGDVETRLNLAGAYFNLKQNDRALAELQTVLQQRPDYDFAMFNMAVIYAAMHEHDKAAEWWNKVIATSKSADLINRAREGLKALNH